MGVRVWNQCIVFRSSSPSMSPFLGIRLRKAGDWYAACSIKRFPNCLSFTLESCTKGGKRRDEMGKSYAWAVPNTFVMIGRLLDGSNAWNAVVLCNADPIHFLQFFSNDVGVTDGGMSLGTTDFLGEVCSVGSLGSACRAWYRNGRWMMYRAPKYFARRRAALMSAEGMSVSFHRSGSGRWTFH
jgi:hypothetical protein